MADMTNAGEVWNQAYQLLLDQPLDLTLREVACLNDIKATNIFGTMVVLTVSSESTRTVIEKKLHTALTQTFSQVTGQPMTYVVQIDPQILTQNEGTSTSQIPVQMPQPVVQVPSVPVAAAPPTQESVINNSSAIGTRDAVISPTHSSEDITHGNTLESDVIAAPSLGMPMNTRDEVTHLNKNARFDNFVPGESNQFAKSIAFAAAERPGLEYNPLFIYGGSGLGKTHLLNAIGNQALLINPRLKVRYTNSEEFTNELVIALGNNASSRRAEMVEFNRRYRGVDILLVDDVQFIAGRDTTVEAFFNTFNELYEQGKQIVLASDVPPKNLKGLPDRLISRFSQGLSVSIDPPSHELRVAILRMKAKAQHIDIPMDVLNLIAEKVTDNVRVLEGALTRVSAMASLSNQIITKNLAEQTLKDFANSTVEITPTNIITFVAQYYKLTFEDIVGSSRTKNVAQARQVAMYLSRELTSMSLVDIGATFGGRDHSTVMHACRKISSEMQEMPETYNAVNDLTTQLKQNRTFNS
ncbi:chromosomal replication initiator protein DnaA [Alloscardovia theropitheci]|uniref:Chromosomal replication initiator protein DnaA n=1 Tax=Alloscardovia theropitheci TaxID=2496842 RepID=A0A4R0QVN3_9BIFI|nr:chromosomal replication initiator protein DnaA [Alloscardovia theropitheci]TCD54297.1 chromosomal replication initiator protein DnaA [Alloscardovia theropitheci]